jgi:hypothetical protein
MNRPKSILNPTCPAATLIKAPDTSPADRPPHTHAVSLRAETAPSHFLPGHTQMDTSPSPSALRNHGLREKMA